MSRRHGTGPSAPTQHAQKKADFGDSNLWTLEILIRGNVIIRRDQKAIQADDCRPRWRSSSRFPLLTPTRVSFEPGASAVAGNLVVAVVGDIL